MRILQCGEVRKLHFSICAGSFYMQWKCMREFVTSGWPQTDMPFMISHCRTSRVHMCIITDLIFWEGQWCYLVTGGIPAVLNIVAHKVWLRLIKNCRDFDTTNYWNLLFGDESKSLCHRLCIVEFTVCRWGGSPYERWSGKCTTLFHSAMNKGATAGFVNFPTRRREVSLIRSPINIGFPRYRTVRPSWHLRAKGHHKTDWVCAPAVLGLTGYHSTKQENAKSLEQRFHVTNSLWACEHLPRR